MIDVLVTSSSVTAEIVIDNDDGDDVDADDVSQSGKQHARRVHK